MTMKKILMMLALLLTAVTGARADEVKTVLDDGVFTGFTATSGSNTGDGGYDKLVDGNTATKWCTNSSPFYIEFHSSGLIVPTGYIMTTGGDTQTYSDRNPKSWTIKAKVNAEDDWTTLATVTDDTTMPAANLTPMEFTISGNTTAYKYFRFEVSATRGDSWFQLSEFQFVGTTTDTGNFTVNPSLSGSGTTESPYLISSADDWNLFASKVNNGTNNYIGKYVQLTANVEVSEMVGLRDGNPFCGTFLGNGHTITANISSTATGTGVNEQGVAPFHYINGATIKNLTVAGTIASASCHTSGLVGFASGINLIEDCTVTATINQNNNYAGGIIGHGQNSNTTIRGCVFAGTINGVGGNRSNIGGIWGWSTSSPVLENCLEKGTYTNIASMHPMGLQGGSGTITDCYYVNPVVGSPSNACTVSGAVRAYITSAPADELSKRVTLQDGNTYYALCAVSGVYEFYQYIGSAITVTPTAICGSTTLTEGTDYTCATTPSTVKELGDYTLTITGTGSCQGTKTIDFSVVDYLVKGKFTINNSGDMVKFVSGNLQATTTDLGKNWTWGFATNQWDHIGNATANNKINGTGTVSENGTIDLFSWVGESSEHTGVAQYGITFTYWRQESEHGNVAGEKLKSDWGQLFGGAYRTLTNDEWDYVLNIRESGSTVVLTKNARYTQAVVNGVKGVILFPNEVNIDQSEAICWGEINAPSEWKTECNAAQWAALEAKGCVFLPVTGYAYRMTLNGNDVQSVYSPDGGFYWSNTSTQTNTGIGLDIESGKLDQWRTYRHYCMAVRLVHDYVTPHVDSYAIADGDTYTATEDFKAALATYTKTTDRAGKYHSWFLPFDHTITATDAEKFTFYKINMIANAIAPDATTTNDMWMYIRPMAEGDVLHANMPYVYKPLEAVTDYVFTSAGATLKAKADDARITMMTAENTYTLYATYEPTSPSASDQFYYMNINGNLSLGNDGTVTVGAFRWIMRVESKFDGNAPAAYARNIIIFDGEETTGIRSIDNGQLTIGDKAGEWFTLDGRKLDGKPTAKGIYVNNGRKVVIK